MLVQCWATVYDAGPTLNQHRVNVSCLLVTNHLRSKRKNAKMSDQQRITAVFSRLENIMFLFIRITKRYTEMLLWQMRNASSYVGPNSPRQTITMRPEFELNITSAIQQWTNICCFLCLHIPILIFREFVYFPSGLNLPENVLIDGTFNLPRHCYWWMFKVNIL